MEFFGEKENCQCEYSQSFSYWYSSYRNYEIKGKKTAPIVLKAGFEKDL